MKLHLGMACRLEDGAHDFVGYIINWSGTHYTFSTPHGSSALLSEEQAQQILFPLTSSEEKVLNSLVLDYIRYKQEHQKTLQSSGQ